MGSCKKAAGQTKKTVAQEEKEEFVSLPLEVERSLLNIIDDFSKKDGITASEELAIMLQIGLEARLNGDVELVTEEEAAKEEKKEAKKAAAPAKKAAPAAKKDDKKAAAPAKKEVKKAAPAAKKDDKKAAAPAKKAAKK